MALDTGGDFAVVADADAGLLAPDKGPPRTSRGGTEDGAFFGEGLSFGGLGCGAKFAMDFVLVGVRQEVVEEAVGGFEFEDVIGREQWWQAFLPVIVAAFDFAFGLRGWGIAELDAVEVEGLAELGEGIGIMGVEERVEVHIQGQRKSVAFEDFGEEVQMGQQGFGGIETCADIEACGIIQDVEEGLFFGVAGQPGMRAGVVLPERPQIPGLPAFDGFGGGFVAGVGSKLVLDGPASDAGAVGFEVEPAMKFAGTGAVGRRGFGGEEFFEQRQRLVRPGGLMIAAGNRGRPSPGLTLGAGAEVLAVKFVEVRAGHSQFCGRFTSGKALVSMAGQEVANEGCGQTFDQL